MGERWEGQRPIENESGERRRWVMVPDSFKCEQFILVPGVLSHGNGLGPLLIGLL